MFQGVTKTLGGMFDSRFPSETWEVIFDAYYSGNANPPEPEQQPNGSYNPNQNNNQNNSQNNSGNQGEQYSDDYRRGWEQAIKDIKAGKIQP